MFYRVAAIQFPSILPSSSSTGSLFEYSHHVINQFIVSPVVPVPSFVIPKIPPYPNQPFTIMQTTPCYMIYPRLIDDSLFFNEGIQWKFVFPMQQPIQPFMTVPVLNCCGRIHKCNQTNQMICYT